MSNIKVNQSILLSPINASRGIIICDIDEEEPKTILEIGGVITNNNHSPPYATITPIPPSHSTATPTITWTTEPVIHEIVPPPYNPYPDANEHKIVPIANVIVPPPTTWSSTNAQEKALQNAERGMLNILFVCERVRLSLFLTQNRR